MTASKSKKYALGFGVLLILMFVGFVFPILMTISVAVQWMLVLIFYPAHKLWGLYPYIGPCAALVYVIGLFLAIDHFVED